MKRLLLIGALVSLAVSAYASVHCRRIIAFNCTDISCYCSLLSAQDCAPQAIAFSFVSCTEENAQDHQITIVWDTTGKDQRFPLDSTSGCGQVRAISTLIIPCKLDSGFCICDGEPEPNAWVFGDDCPNQLYMAPCTN
jgi:hypothetical protein